MKKDIYICNVCIEDSKKEMAREQEHHTSESLRALGQTSRLDVYMDLSVYKEAS